MCSVSQEEVGAILGGFMCEVLRQGSIAEEVGRPCLPVLDYS